MKNVGETNKHQRNSKKRAKKNRSQNGKYVINELEDVM